MTNQPHLTTAQVAELWGVSADTVLRRIQTGQLAGVDVGGGRRPRWRVPVAALATYERRRSSHMPPPIKRVRRRRPAAVTEYF